MSERTRFARLDALFDRALDLDGDARDEMLRSLREEDAVLADELAALLRATEDSHSVLDEPPLAPGSPPAESGDQIGPWRLLRPIGQGGMGSVFLAERADGAFERSVALKLLRGEQSSLARAFALERRALARLDHPGIARLLDAGVDERGRPYLAMEWVDGDELRVWCRKRNATLEARLHLFLDICAAVAYAHRNLVVHRDLKPRNILVTADGAPKLLDFGIAKLIDPDGGETTTIAALTPDYAAPEQLRGEAITTRTDVYALGALLHTLLCDAPPLPTSGLSLAEIIHRVCQQAPPLPSACAAVAGDDAAVPAARLRGDLDAIVSRALSKEPDRRYDSVDALADDVRRHLEARPVRARRPTVGYRLRRFLRRHRTGTAAALVIAWLLGAALHVHRTQTQATEDARATAVIESERATAVRDFLQILVRDIDDEARLSTRELLERAAEDIDQVYANRPQMRVQFHLALASLYLLRSDYVAVDAALERLFAGELEGVPGQLIAEAHCDHAHAAIRRGQADRAAEALAQAWDILDSLSDEAAHKARADCLMIESQRLRMLGEAESSLRPLHQALELRLMREPEDSVDVGIVRTNLGTALNALGRFDEARAEYVIALAILERRGRSQSADAANLQNNLAAVAFAQGHLLEAERRFEKAIELRRRLFGQSAALGALLNNRGKLLLVLDRVEEAAALIDEAVDLQQRFTGGDSVETALMLASRAEVRLAGGNLEEAAKAIAESLQILEARLGAEHLLTWRSRIIALRIDGAAGDRSAADSLARLGDRFEARSAMADSLRAQAQHQAARLYLLDGSVLDAEHAARRALAQHPASDDEHWEAAVIRRVLAESMHAQSRHDEALSLLTTALPVLRDRLGASHSEVRQAESLRLRLLKQAD